MKKILTILFLSLTVHMFAQKEVILYSPADSTYTIDVTSMTALVFWADRGLASNYLYTEIDNLQRNLIEYSRLAEESEIRISILKQQLDVCQNKPQIPMEYKPKKDTLTWVLAGVSAALLGILIAK